MDTPHLQSLRYVVLHHTGIERPHFDLMCETAPGSALATWRCGHWPPIGAQAVERLEDHRREYLEYEGPVSGNRGEVARVELGRCEFQGGGDAWLVRLFPEPARSPLIVQLSQTSAGRWVIS